MPFYWSKYKYAYLSTYISSQNKMAERSICLNNPRNQKQLQGLGRSMTSLALCKNSRHNRKMITNKSISSFKTMAQVSFLTKRMLNKIKLRVTLTNFDNKLLSFILILFRIISKHAEYSCRFCMLVSDHVLSLLSHQSFFPYY